MSADTRGKHIRVLLVEDDKEGAEAIKGALESRGMRITPAAAAEDALSMFSPDLFDVIVADIRLPDMNGIEMLQAIRERNTEFPVILITAYTDLDPARQAVRLGAGDFILKPFDTIEDLVVPVERAVERRRLALENRRLLEGIEQSDNTLGSILSSINDLLFVLDAERRFIRHYSPSGRVLHAPPDEFTGKKHSEVMPPHIDELFNKAFDKCASGETAEYEYALDVGGGPEHWHAKLSPIMSGGEFNGVVAVIRDVTRIKRVELEIVEANRREREKLGWDLQDSVGQQLVGVQCITVALRKMLGARHNLKTELADSIVAHLQTAKDMLRRVSQGLLPTNIAEWGLVDSLKQLARDMREFFGTDCIVKVGAGVMACDYHVQEQIYYMVCEATADAIKHGDAKKIWIELGIENNELKLVVGNNGTYAGDGHLAGPEGVGMEIMRTRAEMIGGRFNLQRDVEGQVIATCVVPCRRRTEKDGDGE